MKEQKAGQEKLNRIMSGPDNFGWAPLAWAYIED
jgi:hypothetical protein